MTDQTLTQQTLSMFSEASSIFESTFSGHSIVRSFLGDYEGYYASCCLGEPVAPYPESDAHAHKSLGCFFDSATGQLSRFLKATSKGTNAFNAEESFSMYALLVDMLWKRMLDVYAVFGVNDGTLPSNPRSRFPDSDGFFSRINARSLREQNEPLYRMSRWTNFFRHPRGVAWLLQRPQVVFAGSEDLKNILEHETRFTLRIIDDEFIKMNHGNDSNDDRTYESYPFERKKVVVVLPDIAILTEEICSCLVLFLEIVGPLYCTMLNKTRSRPQGKTIE